MIPPLETLLASRSQPELITLIGEMIKRHPDLMSVVELSAATQPGRPAHLAAYRRQTRRVLRSGSPSAIDRELWALRDTADRLEKSGDWLGAGGVYQVLLTETVNHLVRRWRQGCYSWDVYQVLLTETVNHYGDELQPLDEDGDIAMCVDEVAEGVSRCLAQGRPDSERRRLWLEAELTDIALGGIDLAPSAWDALLEHTRDADWAWIEQQLRAEIATSHNWARAACARSSRPPRPHRPALAG
ncbi:MAG TPA: hypothetical protein VNP04_07320 [Alphaproteobacteria bacterium]|nr:hypothetical protein [Alphaproteobacteria bacterium]